MSLAVLPLVWAGVAGVSAGFVLGLLGAGGTVTGLPVLLYLAGLSPHLALGTNALGVFMIAAGLYTFRVKNREAFVTPGVAFTLPGLAGIFIGAQVGLRYPGGGLVFLLGFVLFAIAAWMYYLSRKLGGGPAPGEAAPGGRPLGPARLARTAPAALAIGAVAGFFGIGGGFLIVPAFALLYDLDLTRAAASSLLPIAAFSGLVGLTYSAAGKVDFWLAILILLVGLLGGFMGIWTGKRLSKRMMYRVFAAFLAILGVYIIFR